jgi:hypothetical protein
MSIFMLNTLRRVLAAPTFPGDDNKTRSAYYINIVTLSAAPLLFLLFLGRIGGSKQFFEFRTALAFQFSL